LTHLKRGRPENLERSFSGRNDGADCATPSVPHLGDDRFKKQSNVPAETEDSQVTRVRLSGQMAYSSGGAGIIWLGWNIKFEMMIDPSRSLIEVTTPKELRMNTYNSVLCIQHRLS
jgi:hypothetical protein